MYVYLCRAGQYVSTLLVSTPKASKESGHALHFKKSWRLQRTPTQTSRCLTHTKKLYAVPNHLGQSQMIITVSLLYYCLYSAHTDCYYCYSAHTATAIMLLIVSVSPSFLLPPLLGGLVVQGQGPQGPFYDHDAVRQSARGQKLTTKTWRYTEQPPRGKKIGKKTRKEKDEKARLQAEAAYHALSAPNKAVQNWVLHNVVTPPYKGVGQKLANDWPTLFLSALQEESISFICGTETEYFQHLQRSHTEVFKGSSGALQWSSMARNTNHSVQSLIM